MEFTIGISKPGLRKLAADINKALDQAGPDEDVTTTDLYVQPEDVLNDELVLRIGGEDFANANDGESYYTAD